METTIQKQFNIELILMGDTIEVSNIFDDDVAEKIEKAIDAFEATLID